MQRKFFITSETTTTIVQSLRSNFTTSHFCRNSGQSSYELKRKLDNTDKVDLFISVTEQKTGEVSIGLAHSNSSGGALTAGISQNNII